MCQYFQSHQRQVDFIESLELREVAMVAKNWSWIDAKRRY